MKFYRILLLVILLWCQKGLAQDYISDGSDIIHHDMKNNIINIQYYMYGVDKGDIDCKIHNYSDISDDTHIFMHDKEAWRITINCLKIEKDIFIVGDIINIIPNGNQIKFYTFNSKILSPDISKFNIKGTPLEIDVALKYKR